MGGQNKKGNQTRSSVVEKDFIELGKKITALESEVVSTIGEDITKRTEMKKILYQLRVLSGKMKDAVKEKEALFHRTISINNNPVIKNRKIASHNSTIQNIIETGYQKIEQSIQGLKHLLGGNAAALEKVQAFEQAAQQQKEDLKKEVVLSPVMTNKPTVAVSNHSQQSQTQKKPEEAKGPTQEEQPPKTTATSSEIVLPLTKEMSTMTEETQPEAEVKTQDNATFSAMNARIEQSETELHTISHQFEATKKQLFEISGDIKEFEKDVAQRDSQIASLTAEKNFLEGKIKGLATESKGYLEAKEALEKQLKAKESQIEIARDRAMQDKEALSKAQGDLKSMEAAFKKEQGKFTQYKINQDAESARQQRIYAATVNEVNAQVAAKENEIGQMGASMQALLGEVKRLTTNLNEIRDSKSVESAQRIEDLQSNNEALSEMLREKDDVILEQQEVFQREQADLTRKAEALESEKEILSARLEQTLSSKQRLAEEADEREVEDAKTIQQQQKLIEGQAAQLRQVGETLQSVQQERSELAQQLQTVEGEKLAQTAKLASVYRTISEQQDRIEVLSKEDPTADKKDNNFIPRPAEDSQMELKLAEAMLENQGLREENEKLQSERDVLQREKNDFEDELEFVKRDPAAKQHQTMDSNSLSVSDEIALKENKNKVEQLSAQVLTLSEDNRRQQQEKVHLEEALKQEQDKVVATQETLKQTQVALEASENDVKVLTQKKVDLEGKAKELEDKNKGALDVQAGLEKQLHVNQAALGDSERKVQTLTNELEAKKNEFQQSQQAVERIQQEKAGLEDKVRKLETQQVALKGRVQEKESEFKQSQAKVAAQQKSLEQANHDKAVVKDQFEASQGRVEQLSVQLKDTEADNKQLKEEKNNLSGQLSMLRDEHQAVVHTQSTLKRKIAEKDDQVASLTKQKDQLASEYQIQTKKSRGDQETIERLTGQVIHMEKQQHEVNDKLKGTEEDNKHLQEENNKLYNELDSVKEKLKAALDKQPAQTQPPQIQASPAKVKKRRYATSEMGLTEGENLAQQQERPLKIKRFSLESTLKQYGNDGESKTTEGRRNTMTSNAQTVIEQSEEPGILADNISTSSTISQVSTEEATPAFLSRQNSNGSSDDSVFHSTSSNDNDGETSTVAPTAETTKQQKIHEILSSLTPEVVTNKLRGIAELGFLQVQEAKANSQDDAAAAVKALPALNEQITSLSNQHLENYKALLADKLSNMPLNELESVNAVDELLAIESNSTTLKALARKQGETHAQNHLNRFQAAAIAKTQKAFEEVAQEVMADRQGTLSLKIDAKTLAEKTTQNLAHKALESKLIDKIVEIYKANPLDEQQAQARSKINDLLVANKDEIKSAVAKTLTELEDNEKTNQKKQVAITQLFSKIDRDQVSKALVNDARKKLETELNEHGCFLSTSVGKQLEQQINELTRSELEMAKKKLAAILTGKTIEQINALGKQPDQVVKRLIHTPVNPRSLGMQAKEIVTKLAQQEIDSYQNKTAQDLEIYYQSTRNFIKNADERLHFTMQHATSRELRDFTREDRASLENIKTLVKDGKLDKKKEQLQKKLNESGLTPEDEKSYEQAIKSIEGICQQVNSIPAYIDRLAEIETALNAIIAQNDQDSRQAIVKAQSSSHFFKVITTEEELVSAREAFVDKLSLGENNGIGSVGEDRKAEPTHDVIAFNSGNTLIEAIRIEKKTGWLKKFGTFVKLDSLFAEESHITLTYKAVKNDHIIEFSVDSVNADTRPSFIKKHIGNKDFVISSTQSMLEAAQGTGEGRENKGLGKITLYTYDKNWKTRYAFLKAHEVLFPDQYRPRVRLEGKYTNASLISNKSLQRELKKLEDKFIEEYKAQAGSDEHVDGFNTQASLCSAALKPK